MSTSDGLPTGSERVDRIKRAVLASRREFQSTAEWEAEIEDIFSALAGEREPERDSVIVRLRAPTFDTDTVQAFADAVIADGVNAGIEIGHVLESIRAVSFTFPWANRYEVAQWLLGRALVASLETNHRIVFKGLATSPPEASEEPTVDYDLDLVRKPDGSLEWEDETTRPVPPVEPEG